MNIKIVLSLVLCILFFGICFLFSNSNANGGVEANEYFRIHIRANSNSLEDQNIKYEIKDEVVKALTPMLVNAVTKEEAMNIVSDNINLVCEIANQILSEKGFEYVSTAKVKNEYFPSRTYKDVTLVANHYDSLIVYLGEAVGDNWWCVVYPPLCFVGGNNTGENVVYKSRLMEIINNFFGGK